METLEIETLKRQTTFNLVFLTLRNFGLQAVSTLGFFLLTVLLGTGEVGLFAVVSESIGILGYFSDVGLASALIQKKQTPTREELQTTFFIQQLLVLLGLIIFSVIYDRVSQSKNYSLPEFLIALSLCFSFAAASLKTIPSVLMERALNFKLLSTVDIVENTVFYIFAVAFAAAGFGAVSYAIANFIRSLVGLILIYRFSPWPVGFSFSRSAARDLFRFGIPFQLNSFIAVAKDRLSNLFVAGIIGRDAFGLLSWAQKGPRIPLSLMDAVMRITFPTFSRLQDHPDLLRRSLTRSLFFIALLVFPILGGISLLAPDLIALIPKYGKWSPALIPLYVFAFNAAIAAITTPLTNAFNATGRIRLTTGLMIMWTVLTWIFYPLLSVKFGYLGAVAASFIVGLSSVVVWIIAAREFHLSVLKETWLPLAATAAFIVPAVLISPQIDILYLKMVFKIIFSVLVYSLILYFYRRQEILWFIHQLSHLWSKK